MLVNKIIIEIKHNIEYVLKYSAFAGGVGPGTGTRRSAEYARDREWTSNW